MTKEDIKSYETESRANRNRRTQRNYTEKHSNNKTSKRVEEEKENTTKIRIDKERLDEADSLDTSFLEGRFNKKVKNNPKVKETLLKEKKDYSKVWKIGKIIIIGIVLIIGIWTLIYSILEHKDKVKKEKKTPVSETIKEEEKETETEKIVIDENNLFVGDFNTEKLEFSEDFDNYVIEADEKMTTSDLLNDLKNKVYIYNPSAVFIQLGINDLNEGSSTDEIIENLKDIISGIKENRPNAKIYLESIYPINKDVDDYDDEIIDVDMEDIIEVNKEIKTLASSKKITYLDIFDILSAEDELNSDYTDNGVYINENGYKQILKKIRSVIDGDGKKET